MQREEYITIFKKYNTSPNLLKHAMAVEAVMKHFAKLQQEDIEKWGMIGFLHDIDYEKYPEQHCQKCVEILKDEGFSDDIIHAIQSHGYGICSDVEPQEYMEKVLYTIDELTGLVIATALMKPSKKLEEVEVKSLKKKFKTKGFAAGVDRELIQKGTEMLGLELDEVLEQTLIAMKDIKEELGL